MLQYVHLEFEILEQIKYQRKKKLKDMTSHTGMDLSVLQRRNSNNSYNIRQRQNINDSSDRHADRHSYFWGKGIYWGQITNLGAAVYTTMHSVK